VRTAAIVGVGLIGGSFALALRKAGFQGTILGVSSKETISKALSRKAVDEGVPLEDAVRQADLIYLAQPISRILETIPLLDEAQPGALITDAGSTKARILEAARRPGRKAQFLGGHPMAGKEMRGVEAADPELFRDRTYFVTFEKAGELETPAAREFLEWISKIGALAVPLDATAHDRLVAYTSHLPQLISTALAASLSRQMGNAAATGAGPGLLDMTRLAMSSHEIWTDIVATNGELDGALAAYIDGLKELREKLQRSELRGEFEAAAEFSKRLRGVTD
jgi:prephenate dehydrogenase